MIGFGQQRGHSELYQAEPYVADLLPKLYVEILLPEENVEDALMAIGESARTGRIGDEKIFVVQVECVIWIGTGETDEDAI